MKLRKFGQNAYVVAKAVAKGLVNGINEGIDKMETIRKETESFNSHSKSEDTVIDAQMIKELKWLNSNQLRAIFEGKNVRISNEPDAWRQLKWFNAEQLEAIFGKGGPKA